MIQEITGTRAGAKPLRWERIRHSAQWRGWPGEAGTWRADP